MGARLTGMFRSPGARRLARTLDGGRAASSAAGADMTFAGTIALIEADVRRRLMLEGRPVNLGNAIRLAPMPGVVGVVAYRITNFLHQANHKMLARIIDDIQHLYTGFEIHPGSIIGPGLVFGDRPGGGISEHVTIGRNCTVLGGSTMTLNANGIDLSRGRIVLGDHCIIGVGARIVGAVTLGDCTQIKPNAVVLHSSPVAGGILDGIPARRTAVAPVDAVMRWNPLKSVLLVESDAGRGAPGERSDS
jgi:serine acetyltransferase